MKIIADILIGLRKQQDDMAREQLNRPNSADTLLTLNGKYIGLSRAIEYIEQSLRDEDDRQANL